MRTSILILILSVLLITGCATEPGLSYDTGVTKGGAVVLPDAVSDETYSATITGKDGTKPYTFTLEGATSIGGTLHLSPAGVISGTAPTAVDTKIIPFKVNIVDATGKSTILDLSLTVHPPPIILEMPERIEAKLGEEFKHNFSNLTGGNPPYSFTVSGQPMGLIMNLNGDLSGTIPENAIVREYEVEVCVRDSTGAQDCGNTVIDVVEDFTAAGEWTATIRMKSSKTETSWDGVYKVDYVTEGYIPFTPIDLQRATLGVVINTGNGKVTITASGPCGGVITKDVEMTLEARFWTVSDVETALEYDKDAPDIPLPIEPKIDLYLLGGDIVELETDCGELGDFWDYISPFSYAPIPAQYFLSAKDGAVYEDTVPNYFGDLVYVRIEIHKVK